MSESDMEAPAADSLEQARSAAGDPEDPDGSGAPLDVPFDVNEADAAEQQRTVELDEDDYR
jgi:hypothetical protein